MIIHKSILIKLIGVAGCLWLLAACASTPTAAPVWIETPIDPNAWVVEITRPDGGVSPITFAQLRALPKMEFVNDGKTEEGISLLSVLELAGVSEFKVVTLSGGGRSLGLTRKQVDENVLLSFTPRGTLKLAAPNLPRSQWIRDINKIRVE